MAGYISCCFIGSMCLLMCSLWFEAGITILQILHCLRQVFSWSNKDLSGLKMDWQDFFAWVQEIEISSKALLLSDESNFVYAGSFNLWQNGHAIGLSSLGFAE